MIDAAFVSAVEQHYGGAWQQQGYEGLGTPVPHSSVPEEVQETMRHLAREKGDVPKIVDSDQYYLGAVDARTTYLRVLGTSPGFSAEGVDFYVADARAEPISTGSDGGGVINWDSQPGKSWTPPAANGT